MDVVSASHEDVFRARGRGDEEALRRSPDGFCFPCIERLSSTEYSRLAHCQAVAN